MNPPTQKFSPKGNYNNHVYTYIHTYMEKRKRDNTTKNTNVIFYDGNNLDKLKEIAFRNKTDVSSIISNLTREFVLLFESKTPQKTLFNFDEEAHLNFDSNIRDAEFYLRDLTDEKYKEWTHQLQSFMNLERKVTRVR